jgi:hypothetical protein
MPGNVPVDEDVGEAAVAENELLEGGGRSDTVPFKVPRFRAHGEIERRVAALFR